MATPSKDQFHCVWVQSSSNLAQHVCHSVIMPLLIFHLKIEMLKGSYPLVASGTKVQCHHYVSQGVVICLYQEGLIEQVLLEMFCNCPFQCQKLKLGQVVTLLMKGEASATIGDGVISSVGLFLGQHCSKSILGCIHL